jgi:hypothetical protein
MEGLVMTAITPIDLWHTIDTQEAELLRLQKKYNMALRFLVRYHGMLSILGLPVMDWRDLVALMEAEQ